MHKHLQQMETADEMCFLSSEVCGEYKKTVMWGGMIWNCAVAREKKPHYNRHVLLKQTVVFCEGNFQVCFITARLFHNKPKSWVQISHEFSLRKHLSAFLRNKVSIFLATISHRSSAMVINQVAVPIPIVKFLHRTCFAVQLAMLKRSYLCVHISVVLYC